MHFYKWNICPFTLNTRLQLPNSLYWPLSDSPFHDAPYNFELKQTWTADKPVKQTQFVCTKPHCWSTCRMRPDTVLLKCSLTYREKTLWEHVSLKSQCTSLRQWNLYTYANHLCHRHRCTSIPSEMLAFARFADNSLAGLFHLLHGELDRHFSQFFGPSDTSLSPENSVTFLHRIDVWLLPSHSFRLYFWM